MTHYVDIRLRPDPEFSVTQLMNALYAKLHRALVSLSSHDLGVSFPELKKTLGDCLRVHGSEDRLNDLLASSWLAGMRDHVDISPIASVPSHAHYRVVRRVQVQSNPERKRQRYLRRHGGVFQADDEQRFDDSLAQTTDLPFVVMRSQSTGQHFRLFIEHGELSSAPQPGLFNTYGLSAHATIAWF